MGGVVSMPLAASAPLTNSHQVHQSLVHRLEQVAAVRVLEKQTGKTERRTYVSGCTCEGGGIGYDDIGVRRDILFAYPALL